MKRLLSLSAVAAVFVAGCSSNAPYGPSSKAEKTEYNNVSLDVYPADVRQDAAKYAQTPVAWAGVIQQSDAKDLPNGLICIHSTFEHHYFDWQQDSGCSGPRFLVSPRGEGSFTADWIVSKNDPDLGADAATAYAAPGKLAIVYGIPQSVDDKGVVTLKYRFLRVVEPENYTTNAFDYGRFGEPINYLGSAP